MRNYDSKAGQDDKVVRLFLIYTIIFTGLTASTIKADTIDPQTSISTSIENSLSHKKVLLFYSNTLGIPEYRKHFNTSLSIMDSAGVSLTNVYFEFLDITHNNTPENQQYLFKILQKKYRRIKFDVIITISDAAQEFIVNQGKLLFPQTPIIATYSFKKIVDPIPGCHIIQISPEIDVTGTNEIALKLFPNTKHLFVILGAGKYEKQWVPEVRNALAPWADKLIIEFFDTYTYQDMLKKTATLPPNSLILFISFFQDITGRSFVPATVLDTLAQSTNAPVFGMYQEILGKGIVGGSLLNNEDIDLRSSHLACDILSGKLLLTNLLTTIPCIHEPMLDWQQLKKWGIRQADLPKNSVIINRQASIWGTYTWYIISIIIIISVQTFLIVALIINRRKRNLAVKALQESESMHKSMTANISDVISIVGQDGIIRYESPNIEKLFGWRPDELVGLEGCVMIHPQDIARVKDDFLNLLKTENSAITAEYQYKCKNGIYRQIKLTAINLINDPTVAGILMNYSDITDEKETELALAAEKERLAVTLRSIGDGVITTDVSGNIIMINNAAEALTGWSSKDAAGRPLPEVFKIINENTRQQCENPVERVLASGNIIELANHTRLIAKDGREIIIADSGAPIRDNESRIIGVVLVFRDMTEKQRLNDSMQRAQRLESLGVLAGGIAHDFNNLLGGIFGYLDMASQCVAEGNLAQISQYLTKAQGVFERAKALTLQLLTFSKGGNPICKTIQLPPLIKKNSQFALSGSNVSCQFDIADDLWACDCDENQMGQVIDNLIINAIQAMPVGGYILITGKNISMDDGCGGASSRNGKFVKISIKDKGIGMSKELLLRIFDPFFSTKEKGHGLGLATVFSIVQRHDGWIDVESEIGTGSTFHVFLPASSKNNSSSTNPKLIEHNGCGTILVMDDEDFLLEIVGDMLQIMGYSVVTAKNGNEALRHFKLAEESGKPFVAAILDLTIPGEKGGKETVIELRKIKADAIIVASSGYSEDPVMSKPSEHGFTDKIVKPFRKNDLAELLKKIFPDNRQ
jgi:PAS domain S-box-containing protein